MSDPVKLNIRLLTRVEGHADISAAIVDGEVKSIRFDVVEAPRMFEVFLRGRFYDEVVHLASRICGICAVSHRCAAAKATEAAMEVTVSSQTRILRRLAFLGEILSSHLLHVFFLAGPDLFGVPDVFHLVGGDREMLRKAMKLKRLAYRLCDWVAGRHTHPTGMVAGGFTFTHSPADLEPMQAQLTAAAAALRELASWIKTRPLPSFERETLYVCLRHPDRYAFDDGQLYTGNGDTLDPAAYRHVIRERTRPPSTAKHSRWNGQIYMVGALARVNNNYDQLTSSAKEIAAELGLTVPCFNPFMNTYAQIVESAHCLQEAAALLDTLMETGIEASAELTEFKPTAGCGVGAVEAPRGTLFHEYCYDAEGRCTDVNLVIPTAQNLANLEADMQPYVSRIVERPAEEIEKKIEMLARAYDPCISCATHVIDLTDLHGLAPLGCENR